MGIDLKLLPLESDEFTLNVLECERRHVLFDEIQKLNATKISKLILVPFSNKRTLDDNYGETLCWVFAKELLKLKKHEDITDNYMNRAIWAYLSELPEDKKIVLYWC